MQQELSLPGKLGLIAVDTEDLEVLSANLQDAVVRVGDIAFLPQVHRFAFVACRFDWVAAEQGRMERCRTGLHFDRVEKVHLAGFCRSDKDAMLNLLSISFEPTEPPGGTVLFTFSGGAAIRLFVECLDAQLRDIGPRWTTHRKPGHAICDEPEEAR
jgi:hypothetical protein